MSTDAREGTGGAAPPLPEPDDLTRPFWEACREHRLTIQRCTACGHWRHYPRPSCPNCLSFEFAWENVSGKGTLASWVVAHPPVLPYFADKVPLPVVLVQLDEAPHLRLVGGLRDADASALEIGMPMVVVFDDVAEDCTLPHWRPAGAEGADDPDLHEESETAMSENNPADRQERIPIVDYLVLDDGEPYLVATECRGCGTTWLGRRNGCGKCGGREFGTQRLAGEGTIRTFTIVQRAPQGVPAPYVSAVVDLDGGGHVKANVVNVLPDPDHVTLGMPVRLTTFDAATDDSGTRAVAFAYEPREDGS